MDASSSSQSQLTKEELTRFAEAKQAIIANNPGMNEEETKTAIITDFVNLLGWEIPRDGGMEYQFGDYNNNIVDYAFLPTATPKLFIEAKSQQKAIQEKHQNQLKEYLMLDNVDLGILTNGEVYEFYRRFVSDTGDVEIELIERITLSRFSESVALINIFSKSQVVDETYIERLERMLNIQRAQEAIQENHSQISNKIVDIVTDSAGRVAKQPTEDNISKFLDSVDDGLAEMAPTGRPVDEDGLYNTVEEEAGIRCGEENIHFTADKSARDHVRNLVEVLFGHGYLTLGDLPIEAGPTRYMLNTESTDRKGKEMADGEEVVDGVYVELNASKETLKQYTDKIIEIASDDRDSRDISTKKSIATSDFSIDIRHDTTLVNNQTGDPLFPVKSCESMPLENSATVGVYPSDFDRGLPFLSKHNAWGFINIASNPDYFCIYLTNPHQQIQLIGGVKDIISKKEFTETKNIDRDTRDIADSKKVIVFSELYQFENPIPIGESPSRMQGLLYTTLGELRTADTTDDL